MVGRGRLSVSGAVDLANAMVTDGMVHNAITTFASLGTSGQWSQNCERDMHVWLRDLFGFRLQPYTLLMDLQVTCYMWLQRFALTDGLVFAYFKFINGSCAYLV